MSDHPPTYPLVTASATADQPAALRPKQEHFAQFYAAHGNAVRAFREAFDVGANTKYGTVRQRAYELAHEPAVAARVRALLAQAAEGTTISARARMVRLQTITEADPAEIFRVITEPCSSCWSESLALAAALDRGEVPDTGSPQEGCAHCRGHGMQRVIVTPTEVLSPSARKLLKSVRQKASGEIEVHMHDQLAASDQLNRMQGSYDPDAAGIVARAAAAAAGAALGATMAENLTPEQRMAAYLRLTQGN